MKKLHKLILSNLTHLEAGQFISRNLEDLQTANVNLSTDPQIANQINLLKESSNQFDKSLNQIKKQKETDELVALDKARDNAFSVLSRQLKVYELTEDTNEVNAYKALQIVFNNYKGINSYSLEAQTKAMQQLFDELNNSKYQNAIAILPNMERFKQKLKVANDEFNAKFSLRSTDKAAAEVYDTKALRKVMINHYTIYANYVLGQYNMNNDSFYFQILNIINTNRKYFSDLKAR